MSLWREMPERMEKKNGKIRDYTFCYVLNKRKGPYWNFWEDVGLMIKKNLNARAEVKLTLTNAKT
jgi:hypothetical protein